MGTLGRQQQNELDRLADKAAKVWNWELGEDVNPALLDPDDLIEVYNKVYEAIGPTIDEFAARVGTIGFSESHLRGTFFPKIWGTISATGVFYDFDYDPDAQEYYGEIHPATKDDIRRRLLRRRSPAGIAYAQWNKNNKSQRTVKRKEKHAVQVRWNQAVVDAFDAAATQVIDREDCWGKMQTAELMVALQWFAGRRPWAELGLRADFKVIDGPEWADGWLMFSGHAKQTRAEKEGIVPQKRWPIPLFGIDPDLFMEGFERFRDAQSTDHLFDPNNFETGHTDVKQSLYYFVKKVLKGGFAAEAFAPVLDAGYDYEITMHRFRDLYVSRGHWYQSQWAMRNGQSAPNIQSWAATYLGHFGDGSEEDTGEYLKLDFLGEHPIPKLVV